MKQSAMLVKTAATELLKAFRMETKSANDFIISLAMKHDEDNLFKCIHSFRNALCTFSRSTLLKGEREKARRRRRKIKSSSAAQETENYSFF